MDPPKVPPSPHTPPKQKGIPGAPVMAPPPRHALPRNCDLSVNLNTLPRSFDQLPPLSSPYAKPSEVKPGTMQPPPPPRHRREGQYQEMVDAENARKAQEERDAHFMERLPHVQLLSRRLQSHLEINDPTVWPTPRVPDSEAEGNECFLERNTKLLQDALDDCNDYAFKMDRESKKGQVLDRVMKERLFPQQARAQAGCGAANAAVNVEAPHNEDEVDESQITCEAKNTHFIYKPTLSRAKKNKKKKKNRNTRNDADDTTDMISDDSPHAHKDALPNVSDQGQTKVDALDHDGDETMPDQSSKPPSECSGDDPTAPSQGLVASPSARYNPHDAKAVAPAHTTSKVSPAQLEGNASVTSMPHSSDFGAPPNSDELAIPSETHIQPSEQGATQSEIDLYNAHSGEIFNLWVEDGNDSTQSHKDRRWANAMTGIDFQPGYDSDGNTIGMREWNRRCRSSDEEDDEEEEKEDEDHVNDPGASSASPDGIQSKGKGKERAHSPTFKEKLAELPQSQGMDYLNHTKESVVYKVRTRTPLVPQPQNMPGTLTQALCHWYNLTASPLLTLTLEDVGVSMRNPKTTRCVLLQHFEIGLDGVEAIIRGQVIVPETAAVKAEREGRLQKLGTRKVADGGYYNALKKVQEDMNHGKGYWCFWGVRFKQTKAEKKLRKPAKWLFFGAPIEATEQLAVPPSQQKTVVLLGGGPGRRGATVGRYPAKMQRCQMLLCKGGVAPIDSWPGSAAWKDGLVGKIKNAMADNGLRLTFLFDDRMLSQATITHRANACSIAAKVRARKGLGPEAIVVDTMDASNVAKKRKAPSTMTPEEEKEMRRMMAQGQKPDVGRMIANNVLQEIARQNAQRAELGGVVQNVGAPAYPVGGHANNEAWKKEWLDRHRRTRAGMSLPTIPYARRP
ncbi:hypothetical protein N7G274_005039 [Stereocaulon virgatum]|uniref:Uncharacterized protein n=1 Tax=Stereocaulon virgatum TaxID=373712 RepID=A0ABR4A9U1_9LECA